MTRDDIIRMAREAGFWQEHTNTWMCNSQDMERFAALVITAEREACAKMCEVYAESTSTEGSLAWIIPNECAAAIRARGQA